VPSVGTLGPALRPTGGIHLDHPSRSAGVSSAVSERRSVPLRRSSTRTQNHCTRDASDMTGSRAKPPMAMNALLIY
jgi:hypothetical protein